MKHFIFLAIFTLSAGAFAGEHINPKEAASQAEAKRNALVELQQDMTTKFAQIESDLDSGKFGSALNLAKQVLDTVRAKTGIDPKVKIQESFLVPTIFSKEASRFTDLSEAQQVQVIRAVSDFRGGLYMDIMNLSKRTSLLYIRALKRQMELNGGLNNEDKHKIKNDLIRASLIPMKIEDKKGHTIIAFDEDIANEDHIFMFNREVKIFLTTSTDLAVSEEGFKQHKEHYKRTLTLAPAPAVERPLTPLDILNQCLMSTRGISTFSSRDAAKMACIRNYAATNTANYEVCGGIPAHMSLGSNKTSAYNICITGIK